MVTRDTMAARRGQVLGIQVYDLDTKDITWITKSVLLVSKFLHEAGHQVADVVVGMAGLKRPAAGLPLHPGDHGDPRHHGCPPGALSVCAQDWSANSMRSVFTRKASPSYKTLLLMNRESCTNLPVQQL